MKNQVLTILQISPEAYEKLVMDIYFDWCSKKAQNEKSLQKVLTCRPLFNWWYKQLTDMEVGFVEQGEDYIDHITPQAAEDFYIESISNIYKLFSKPLIKKAYDA